MKEIADLKEYLANKINDLRNQIAENQEELELLTNIMKKVDSLLIEKSFTPAKELYNQMIETKTQKVENHIPPFQDQEDSKNNEDIIKYEDVVLATMKSTEKGIVFELTDKIRMNGEEPPFKSFIMNKIVKEFQGEDKPLIEAKKLKENEIFSIGTQTKYQQDIIEKILVINYRTKKRKDKIIKAISWSLRTIYQGKK